MGDLSTDWQIYYDAASKCHEIAADLRTADKPLHDALKGECGGMAGDAPGCEQWGRTYDRHAQETLQTCTNLADALTNFGYVLYATGYNYGKANGGNPTRPRVNALSEYKVSFPTSVGANGDGIGQDGGSKEFYDELLEKVKEEFGKLPNGDKDKLATASSRWKAFAQHDAVTKASERIKTITGLFDNVTDKKNLDPLLGHLSTLGAGAEQLAAASMNIAGPVGEYHTGTEDLRNGIQKAVTNALWAAGAIVITGIAASLFTACLSDVAAAGGVVVVVGNTVRTIKSVYDGIKIWQVLAAAAAATGAAAVVTSFDKIPSIGDTLTKLGAIIALKVYVDDEATPPLKFEPSPKHGPQQRGNAAPEPTHPQETLERSVQIKETSSRRVAYDPETGEFDVFDETHNDSGIYHGHQRKWEELTQEMQNALVKAGVVNRKGKPL
ncbi:hypothetical protein [Nocardia gipuzkoensis]